MNYTNITFDKSKTAIIKGFAIVFMIILHVFGGSGWYDVDLPMNHNESLISFMGGHALFFTAATRPVFAKFVLISDNLWIIALWTIVLCYICSAVIKKIVEYKKHKNE